MMASLFFFMPFNLKYTLHRRVIDAKHIGSHGKNLSFNNRTCNSDNFHRLFDQNVYKGIGKQGQNGNDRNACQ